MAAPFCSSESPGKPVLAASMRTVGSVRQRKFHSGSLKAVRCSVGICRLLKKPEAERSGYANVLPTTSNVKQNVWEPGSLSADDRIALIGFVDP
jgi:hypothetical protein